MDLWMLSASLSMLFFVPSLYIIVFLLIWLDLWRWTVQTTIPGVLTCKCNNFRISNKQNLQKKFTWCERVFTRRKKKKKERLDPYGNKVNLQINSYSLVLYYTLVHRWARYPGWIWVSDSKSTELLNVSKFWLR